MEPPSPIPFDTHRFVKRMTEAGMPAVQAEALAAEQVALLGSQLATKQDFVDLATRLEGVAARQEGLATKEEFAALVARQKTLATREQIAELVMEFAVIGARIGRMLWLISSIGGGVLFLVGRTVWAG